MIHVQAIKYRQETTNRTKQADAKGNPTPACAANHYQMPLTALAGEPRTAEA
jgi:hypothetical protein